MVTKKQSGRHHNSAPDVAKLGSDDNSEPGLHNEGLTGFLLVPGHRQSLGDQLYGQILDMLANGQLKKGDRLPSEQKISAMFGVSRPIVRNAIMRLRTEGLVQVRQGSGTYVLNPPIDPLKTLANDDSIDRCLRCIEVRMPLEATAAKLAAQRRSSADLTRIVDAHEKFRKEFEHGEAHHKTDMAFHAAIAAASANEFFQHLLDQIRDALDHYMSFSLDLARLGTEAEQRKVIDEHSCIVEAIQSQDGDMAEVAMQFHIGQATRRMVVRGRAL